MQIWVVKTFGFVGKNKKFEDVTLHFRTLQQVSRV